MTQLKAATVLITGAAGGFGQALTTDPNKIMAATIRAIERNQNEVFPDKFALIGHWVKRYFPFVFRSFNRINLESI